MMRSGPVPALLAVAVALAAGLLVGGCGGERERLGQELAAQLAAAGIEAFDVSVWPPHGMVPHTNVELRVEGDEDAARAACATTERLAVYDGEQPYLVRVTFGAGRVVECGWGAGGLQPSGASPGAPSSRPTVLPPIGTPVASPLS